MCVRVYSEGGCVEVVCSEGGCVEVCSEGVCRGGV